MCILCWWRTGEDGAEFIHWSCRHAERLTRHGALGTDRHVRTGDWEACVRGEGSAGWAERYSCLWDVFRVQVSFTGGSIKWHVPGFGWACPGGGEFAGRATCRARKKRHLGAVYARVRGIHGFAWHMRCSAGFTCKRR
jgi:hypothetical protein